MKIKTHVTILISSLLIYLSIHYIGVLIYSKDSLVFQIMIWVTTILVDMIICSYLVYFSSIKRGHAYRFWMLLTFGSILYFIGDIIVAYQRLILHDSAIFVDPSDFFYLLCLIIFVVAFLYELLYDRNIWEQLFIICDVCIVVTAQFTLSYYLLIEQAIHIIATTYLNIIVQLMYPMANLLFLLIGISLLFRPLSLLSKQVSIF